MFTIKLQLDSFLIITQRVNDNSYFSQYIDLLKYRIITENTYN